LVDHISFELSLHASAEVNTWYPALRDVGMGHDSDEALDEHQEMKEALVVLARTVPGEPEFERTLAKLLADVRHHVEDEENQILPQFREAVGPEKIAQLGKDFITSKRHAPTHPHPGGPSSGLGHTLADITAKLMDLTRDKVSGQTKQLSTDASGLLDSQAQAIVDAHSSLEPLPFETLTPAEARKQPGPDDAVKKVMADLGLQGPEEVGSVDDRMIPGPGGELKIRVYKPKSGDSAGLPIILWVHGGGWVLFDIDTYDASCRGLTNKTGAIVVSPDYRRAPEAVFPASHDDVLATYRWLVSNGAEIGGDPTRIGIGGESVGGTMAAATSLQLLQAGDPVPAAQVCVYPLTTPEQFGESMDDAADGRPLNRALLSWMAMHAFEGVDGAADDMRVNLLGVPKATLAGMPPTLVITDERDVLRSQGQEFARKLEAAGVRTRLQHYDGVMHEFFGASAVLDKAEEAQQEAAQHFLRAFQGAGADPYPTESIRTTESQTR
ncbi:MAG: putative lipase, partial [Frankiales bacterium]|nr:putative lipase [Frankiales bacterium]